MKQNEEWLLKYNLKKKVIMKILFQEDMEFLKKMNILSLFPLFIAIGISGVTRILVGSFSEHLFIWIMWSVVFASAIVGILATAAKYSTRYVVLQSLGNKRKRKEFETRLKEFL